MAGRTVLVHGGAGAVGLCAVQLARRAGAVVIATVRSPDQEATGRNAGAHHVVIAGPKLVDQLRDLAPDGVHHIVDVAFGANVAANVEVLSVGGSIAAYATDGMTTAIPFWPLVFKNVRVCFLGSDDFPPERRRPQPGSSTTHSRRGGRASTSRKGFPCRRSPPRTNWSSSTIGEGESLLQSEEP